MRIDRRAALSLLGLGAAAPAMAQQPAKVAFRHGVASGDPLQDRVVIWTRITPEQPGGEIAYRWRMNPVDRRAGGAKSGTGTTGPARDYTCKVDVTGLDPGRAYTFEFEAAGVRSPVGRTRTLPAGRTKEVVLAIASCSLYPQGYFNAYQAIADLPRLDAVLHLGDYIYEYGGPGTYGMSSAVAGERPHDPPHEIVTLADYRRRHAQYKSDPQLQAAHARAPWIVVWDDHESTNDSYFGGAQNHQPEEGDWTARKATALKAYYEWMPIREPAPGVGLAEAAMRSFHFGDLASLIMIETRLSARDRQLNLDRDMPQVDGKPDVAAFRTRLNDPQRRLLGPRQEAWIAAELARSVAAGHAWQVIGNQVIMARVAPASAKATLSPENYAKLSDQARQRSERMERLAALGVPAGLDMWDGYPVDRERLYGIFRQAGARPIVVSGDSHAFWANELHDESGRRVACEFGATGITSPGAGEVLPGYNTGKLVEEANPEVVFNDQVTRGFCLLTLTPDEARADMVGVSTITSKAFEAKPVAGFRARPDGKGVSALTRV